MTKITLLCELTLHPQVTHKW